MIFYSKKSLIVEFAVIGISVSLDATNPSAIISQLQKTKQVCIQDVHPVQMASPYLAPLETVVNNLCLQKPAITQQGNNEIIITGQATEQGLEQGVPIRIVADIG